jgi:hypothetical protein
MSIITAEPLKDPIFCQAVIQAGVRDLHADLSIAPVCARGCATAPLSLLARPLWLPWQKGGIGCPGSVEPDG